MLCEKIVNFVVFWNMHGGKGVNVFKFCSIDLMKTRSMLHLRHEMVYSAYYLVLEVNKTSPRRFKQQQRASNSGGVYFECRSQEGTNILTASVLFLCG